MLSSHQGSVDGRRVQWYLAGETYEVSESLAAIFIKEGWAEDDDTEEDDDATAAEPNVEVNRVSAPKAEGKPHSGKQRRR